MEVVLGKPYGVGKAVDQIASLPGHVGIGPLGQRQHDALATVVRVGHGLQPLIGDPLATLDA